MAIVANGTDEVSAVSPQFVATALGHKIAVAAPLSSSSTCFRSASTVNPIPFPGNMVASGTTLLFPDDTGGLQRVTYGGSGSVSVGGAFPDGGLASGTVNGLALVDIAGLRVAAGSGGTGTGKLSVLAESSAAIEGDTGAPQNPVSSPVITSTNAFIAAFRQGPTLEIKRFGTPLASGWIPAATLPWQGAQNASSPVAPSPVLGEGDLAYFVSVDQHLLVATQMNLTQKYEGPISGSLTLGPLTASPTIDCNRSRPGTASTGILYVATEGGYLVSLIIDSKGLDTTAQWPKYQHDQFNTGNLVTPIPGCP